MKQRYYRSAFLRLCFVTTLHGAAGILTTSAQSPVLLVSNNHAGLQATNTHITDVLKELENKYGIFFTYKDNTLKGKIVPTNLRKSGKLESILDFLLKPQGIEYKKAGKVYYLYLPEELNQSRINPIDNTESKTINREETSSFAVNALVGKDVKTVVINNPIKGKVLSETGEPMPGVNIRLKGTTIGASTNINGNYTLNLPEKQENGTLVFSMIGYNVMEVSIKSRTIINVTLNPDVKSLNEVVVVGYGTQQKKDVTGSISSIKMEELRTIPATGLDQAIQGRVSGVTVTNNSGQPGSGLSVRIRGISSLTGTNEPLYVIDGVPVDGDGQESQGFAQFGGGNGQVRQSALATINPNDIVSIDILKDASATAIYGSRGSNGVVIVTTKRGKANDSRITYDTFAGYQESPRSIDMMNLQDYAIYQNNVRTQTGQRAVEEFADPSLLGEGTNWQKEIFRRAFMQSHQLGISGGSDRTQFYISGGYLKQNGIVIGSDFDRYSFRLNLDNKVNNWLKIGNSFTIARTSQRVTLNDDDNGVVSAALLQAPNVPVKNPDGNWGGAEDADSYYTTNPVALALIKDFTRQSTRMNGNIWADFSLLKSLSLRTEFGGDINLSQNSAFNPTYKWGRLENTQNKLIRTDNQNYFWIAKAYLNYNHVFNNIHKVSAILGHEAQQFYYESLTAARTGFFTNDLTAVSLGDAKSATNENGKGTGTMESYFARVNYGYGDRYNLTLTVRRDGVSKFANKWGTFPSAAFAWTVSSEKFMKSLTAVSNLKLRVGYGAVGNSNISSSYAYGVGLSTIQTAYGTGFVPDKIANPNVKWESSFSTNLGVDLGLINNKINLSVDYYDKTSYDFLYQRPVPAYTGSGSNWDQIKAPFVNLGRMENKGVDLTLNATILEKSNGLKWNTTLIFSHYRNKLLELVDEQSAIFENVQWFETVTKTAVGQPVGQFYGYKVAGIFQTVEEIKNSPKQKDKIDATTGTYVGDLKFVDLNGDGVIDGNDRTYIGSPHPDFTFGFTNNLSFKGFDLSIFLQGSQGAKIYNFTRRYTEGMDNLFMNQRKNITNSWTPANTETTIPRYALGDPNDNRRTSERFLEDGSYIRIQNVTLGYNLPKALVNKMKLKNLKLYTSLQNLYTITNYTGFDPELGSYNQNARLTNVDNGHYPNPRTYTLGLNVEF
jgi:TonB-dependent starch-binding outer membrane protein SusC